MTRANTETRNSSLGPVPAYFDWYAATLEPEVDGADAFDALRVQLGGQVVQRPGRHGYEARREIRHGNRCVVGVSYGGAQPRCLIESSGGDAVQVSDFVRSMWPRHRVTRVDTCLDFDDEGAWEHLSSRALSVARARGIKTRVHGDWLTPGAPDGRTLAVGGRTASVQLRVYEKGKQIPLAGRPNWTRCELEVRPERAAKVVAAGLSAGELWGASTWSQELGQELLQAPVERVSMRGYLAPDYENAREALVSQYYGVLTEWAAEYGNDWRTFGEVLGEEVDRVRASRA